MRAERVREINFFSNADTFDIEGVCLVVFRQPPPLPRPAPLCARRVGRPTQAFAPSAPAAFPRFWKKAATRWTSQIYRNWLARRFRCRLWSLTCLRETFCRGV